METLNQNQQSTRNLSDELKFLLQASIIDGKELIEDELSSKDSSWVSREIGESHYRMAKVYYDKSDFENAEKFFLRALDYTLYPRDSYAMFKCFGFLIRIYSEEEREEEANVYISKTQELITKLGSDLGSLSSEYFYNVGMMFTYKGLFVQACENFSLSNEKAQKENDSNMMAKSLYSLSNAYFQQGKLEESMAHLTRLEDLMKVIEKDYLMGSTYFLKASLCRELGRFSDSIHYFDLSLQFLQQKNCWNLMGYILLGKGMTYKKLGEYQNALTFFKLAKSFAGLQNFRLKSLVQTQEKDVNDSNVDLYLDRINRVVHEKNLGVIDFKHRFVLLEILFLLAKSPGEYFDKEDLAKSIWKDEYNPLIHDKLIYTSISRLRKLIEPKGNHKRKYIQRGKDGYTFNPHTKIRFHKEKESVQPKVIGNIEICTPV